MKVDTLLGVYILEFQILKDSYNHLSILYVEDFPEIRETTCRTFLKLFNVVDSANDGKEGLEKYKDYYYTHDTFYDIVVSDIEMPHMNGIDFSREILKLNPNQKILITSAYDDKDYLKELINIGVEGFIQKPFSSKTLLETLYKVCKTFKQDSIVTFTDAYKYDTFYKTLYKEDEKIDLSSSELKMLDFFVKNKNVYLKAEDLFNHIYFDEPDREFSSDSIKSLLKRLRKKLPPDLIKNQHGLGYRLTL